MHDNVFNHSSGYFGKIIKDYWINCGREFWLDSIRQNVEDNTFVYTLSTIYQGKKIVKDFPKGNLDKKFIGALQAVGFDVNSSNFDVFVKVLQNEELEYENNPDFKISHRHIGWQEVNINDKGEFLFKSFGSVGKYVSKYQGTFDIQPKGTLQAQLDMIHSEVEKNTPLEAILAISASAILNGYIGHLVQTDTPIVHLLGDSTRGKTTAAQLAISVAGSCNLHGSSLFMSWNGTYNSIISRMKGNYGFPVAFDEISKFHGKNFAEVVYTLSDGREKDRCNKDANLKTITQFDCWRTVLISTGEASLLSKCNMNTGLRARVIELDDLFTTSAQNAENIKNSVRDNYGNIAPKFSNILTRIGQDELVKKHAKYKSSFLKYCNTQSKLDERLSNIIALFLLSAKILNSYFKLQLNITALKKYFADSLNKNNLDADIADKALSMISEYVNVHEKNFIHKYKAKFKRFQVERGSSCNGKRCLDNVDKVLEADYTAQECFGKIIDGDCFKNSPDISRQILIYYERFKKIVKALGFEDEGIVLSQMKAKGYLDCENGKNYRKRKIQKNDKSSTTHVIVINEPNDKDLSIEETTVEEEISIDEETDNNISKMQYCNNLHFSDFEDFNYEDFIGEDDDD